MFARFRLPFLLLLIAMLALLTPWFASQQWQQAAAQDNTRTQQAAQQRAQQLLQDKLGLARQWLHANVQHPRWRDLAKTGAQTPLQAALADASGLGISSVLLYDATTHTLHASDAPGLAGETRGLGEWLQSAARQQTESVHALDWREKPVLLLTRTLPGTGNSLMLTFTLDTALADALARSLGHPLRFSTDTTDGHWQTVAIEALSGRPLQLQMQSTAPSAPAFDTLWILAGAITLLALITTFALLKPVHRADPWSPLVAALPAILNGNATERSAYLSRFPDAAKLLVTLEAVHQQQHATHDNLRQQLADMEAHQQNLQAQNQRTQKERDAAMSAPRTRSEFLSRMGDEITTPMNSLMSMLNLVNEFPMAAEPKDFLAIANRSARALVDNLNNILDFTKLDAGLLKLQPEPFSPHTLVSALINDYAPHAQSKNLRLSHNLNADVPQQVFADQVRVHQILANLISNALRFTNEGEVGVYVDVIEHPSRRLRFTISDTGLGIPRDAQTGLFDSLDSRSKLTNASFAGRLRLIVCKMLAEAMGGEIGVSSEQGKGSRFWFTIALQRV